MWLWEDSLKHGWTLNIMSSNYLTIKSNRNYPHLHVSQILNVFYKQMTCIYNKRFSDQEKYLSINKLNTNYASLQDPVLTSHTVVASAWQKVMNTIALQCFCAVTRSHVIALTVMAVGTRTLQDTNRHSLTGLQHNVSWLPGAMCHCSRGKEASQVNTDRTDTHLRNLHLTAHIYRYFIMR